MTRIGIVLGSTRVGRNGAQVADWVAGVASQRDDAEYELVDLRDFPLPHLGEDDPRGAAEVGAVVAAWASYTWVEAPFLRIKERSAAVGHGGPPANLTLPRREAPVAAAAERSMAHSGES